MGSFLGVLIRRLPDRRPVAVARSRCEACGAAIPAWHMLPIASFLALRGRAACCGAPIARAHLGIELAAIGVAAWAASVTGADPARLWIGCAVGWTLLALGWIDAERMVLPDGLTLGLLLGGLAEAWAVEPWALFDRSLGAAAGFLLLRGVAAGYRRLRGRDGLGQGDAKLLAAIGAWTGWQALPMVLLGAALLGLATALVRRQKLHAAAVVPFGPALAVAGWLVWLYGLG
ncbi:MAG TPA: A24 family peptidase [Acetobacteraceae bacterium]|nr:A24 family peptidase [Acetobacteraceae bacterium]